MVDPGFPRRGANPKREALTFYLAKIFRQFHENEEYWTEMGAGHCEICRSSEIRPTDYKDFFTVQAGDGPREK